MLIRNIIHPLSKEAAEINDLFSWITLNLFKGLSPIFAIVSMTKSLFLPLEVGLATEVNYVSQGDNVEVFHTSHYRTSYPLFILVKSTATSL